MRGEGHHAELRRAHPRAYVARERPTPTRAGVRTETSLQAPLREEVPHCTTGVQVHFSYVTRKLRPLIDRAYLVSTIKDVYHINMLDLVMKKQVNDSSRSIQSGYGFVFFLDYASAEQLVRNFKGLTLNGVSYDCNISLRSKQILGLPLDSSSSEDTVSSPRTAHTRVASQQQQPNPTPKPSQFASPPVGSTLQPCWDVPVRSFHPSLPNYPASDPFARGDCCSSPMPDPYYYHHVHHLERIGYHRRHAQQFYPEFLQRGFEAPPPQRAVDAPPLRSMPQAPMGRDADSVFLPPCAQSEPQYGHSGSSSGSPHAQMFPLDSRSTVTSRFWNT